MNSVKYIILAVIVLSWLAYPVRAQEIQLVFYNVENLFDASDAPDKNDDEFTPEGERHWTEFRVQQKTSRIAQVLIALGKGRPPAIVGLAEVENLSLLQQLCDHVSLNKSDYRIVHHESPDKRGIDVALMFRKDQIEGIDYAFYPVEIKNDPSFSTREILYFKGIIASDTLHVLVNHWPSKYGGAVATIPLRMAAAKVLNEVVDSLFQADPKSKIIIMGDFNDTPFDESVKNLTSRSFTAGGSIHNLSLPTAEEGKGSHKYRGEWSMLDQVLISNALLSDQGIHVKKDAFEIFSPAFLLEDDKNYLGKKPFRTYLGYKYQGGFSDHLPVFISLELQ